MSSAFSRTSQPVSPNRKRGGEFAWLTAMAFVLVLSLLLIAAKRRNLHDLGYKLDELRTECANLKEDQARLRTELARLTSPDRVVAESQRIGLRPIPASNRIQIVNGQDLPEPEMKPSEPVLVASGRREP